MKDVLSSVFLCFLCQNVQGCSFWEFISYRSNQLNFKCRKQDCIVLVVLALLDLSMTWSYSGAKGRGVNKGSNWLVLILSDRSKRGIAHHCKSRDLWGAPQAAQPEIASDKEQMAPRSSYQDACSVAHRQLLNPACDDTTFLAKSQSTRSNWLSPTSQKDFQKYKNWHLKTLFGRRSQARTLRDEWVDDPEPLSPTSKKGRLFW